MPSVLLSSLPPLCYAMQADQSAPANVPCPHEAPAAPISFDSSDSSAKRAAAGAEPAETVALLAKIKGAGGRKCNGSCYC